MVIGMLQTIGSCVQSLCNVWTMHSGNDAVERVGSGLILLAWPLLSHDLSPPHHLSPAHAGQLPWLSEELHENALLKAGALAEWS